MTTLHVHLGQNLHRTDIKMASNFFGYFLLIAVSSVAMTTAVRLPTDAEVAEHGRRALRVLLQDSTFTGTEGDFMRYFTKPGGHIRANLDFTKMRANHITVINQGGAQVILAHAGDRRVTVEHDSQNRPVIKLISGYLTMKETVYKCTYLP